MRRSLPATRPLALGAGLMCMGSFAMPSPVAAQAPRAAIVVEGAARSTDGVQQAVAEALRRQRYEVVDQGAVEAARAFAVMQGSLTPVTAQQLRAALQASVLVVVAVRPAARRQRYVAVHRYTGAGVQQQFGETAPDAVATFAVRTLLAITNPAGASAVSAGPVGPVAPLAVAPVGAPVTVAPVGPSAASAPQVAQGVGAPPAALAAPVGNAAPAAPVASAAPVGNAATAPAVSRPVGVPGATGSDASVSNPSASDASASDASASDASASEASASDSSGPSSGVAQDEMGARAAPSSTVSALSLGGAIGLVVGAASYLATPLGGGLGICNTCEAHIGFGFIPLVGAWIDLDLTPPSDGGLAAFYGIMGTLQLLGFGASAALFAAAMLIDQSERPNRGTASVLPWVAPSPEGAMAGVEVPF